MKREVAMYGFTFSKGIYMNGLKQKIKQAIQGVASGKPLEQGRRLLNALGYQSQTTDVIAPNT